MLASAPPDDDNVLDPTDQADLEEEAAKYNKNYPPKLVTSALRKNPSSKNPFVRRSQSTAISKTQRPSPFQPPTPDLIKRLLLE